jgi:hypothetical protein
MGVSVKVRKRVILPRDGMRSRMRPVPSLRVDTIAQAAHQVSTSRAPSLRRERAGTAARAGPRPGGAARRPWRPVRACAGTPPSRRRCRKGSAARDRRAPRRWRRRRGAPARREATGPGARHRQDAGQVGVVEIVAERRIESAELRSPGPRGERPCWCRAASAPFPGQRRDRIIERHVAPLPVHRDTAPLERDAVSPQDRPGDRGEVPASVQSSEATAVPMSARAPRRRRGTPRYPRPHGRSRHCAPATGSARPEVPS